MRLERRISPTPTLALLGVELFSQIDALIDLLRHCLLRKLKITFSSLPTYIDGLALYVAFNLSLSTLPRPFIHCSLASLSGRIERPGDDCGVQMALDYDYVLILSHLL